MTTSAPALRARGHVRLDGLGRQARAADPRRGRVVTAGDRVVAEDRDLRPARLEDGRLAGRREVLARAGDRDAALRDVLDRLEQPGRAGVADVVVGQRDVVDAGVGQAVDEPRVGREDRPRGVEARVVRRRVLEVGDGDVGALDQVAERAGVAGPLRVRQVPAERRAVLAAAGDLGRAAVEREVGALALEASGRRRGRAGCRRRRTGSRSSPGRRRRPRPAAGRRARRAASRRGP